MKVFRECYVTAGSESIFSSCSCQLLHQENEENVLQQSKIEHVKRECAAAKPENPEFGQFSCMNSDLKMKN